jgi:enoyl-CoA hydratase
MGLRTVEGAVGEIERTIEGGVATVVMRRGKVNAINEAFVDALHETFEELDRSPEVRAVVLTGSGSFFSFGFDIPEFMDATPDEFTRFLVAFTGFYRRLFQFPKPVIGALNGHTIAGGCMMALACDRLLMASGRAKISLNEIGFGSSVFAGCVAMLRERVGARRAESILFGGRMYTAFQAVELKLVDQVCGAETLGGEASHLAREFATRDPVAFASIKRLLRGPVVEEIDRREADSIHEFVEIWYSDSTRKHLAEIRIR